MLVDPFSERDVPVEMAVDPRAFEVVVAPVDFAAGTGVGLASGFIAGRTGTLSIAAGPVATDATTGTAVGACSVGTFGTTIAELAAGPDVAGAKLAAAPFDCRASGIERSIFGNARDAGGAAGTGATGTAGAGAAAFAGTAGFAAAVDFAGAAARAAGSGAAGLAGS